MSNRSLKMWLLSLVIMPFLAIESAYAITLDPVIAACQRSLSIATIDIPVEDFSNSNNLRTPVGSGFHAHGHAIIVRGRIFDQNCVPISDAIIRLWETDDLGKMPASFAVKPKDDKDDYNESEENSEPSDSAASIAKAIASAKAETPTITIKDKAAATSSADVKSAPGKADSSKMDPKDEDEKEDKDDESHEKDGYVTPFAEDKLSKDPYFVGAGTAVSNNLGHFNVIGIMPGATDSDEPHLNIHIYHPDFAIFKTKIYFTDDQQVLPIAAQDPNTSPRIKVYARKNPERSNDHITWYDIDMALSAPNVYRHY